MFLIKAMIDRQSFRHVFDRRVFCDDSISSMCHSSCGSVDCRPVELQAVAVVTKWRGRWSLRVQWKGSRRYARVVLLNFRQAVTTGNQAYPCRLSLQATHSRQRSCASLIARRSERICSLVMTGLSTDLVCGLLTASPGSSLRYFYFLARRVIARMLVKQ